MSEQLTVKQSVDGQIVINGTKHALGMVAALIGQLLDDPSDFCIRADNPASGVSIVINRIPEGAP